MDAKLKKALIGIGSVALVSLGATLGAMAGEVATECPECAPCQAVEATEDTDAAEVVPSPVLSPDAEKAPLEGGALIDEPSE